MTTAEWAWLGAFLVIGALAVVWAGWRWRFQSVAEIAALQRRVAELEADVMAGEARSRGVGGTGEHRTTLITPLTPPGWAARHPAPPPRLNPDAPRPARPTR